MVNKLTRSIIAFGRVNTGKSKSLKEILFAMAPTLRSVDILTILTSSLLKLLVWYTRFGSYAHV